MPTRHASSNRLVAALVYDGDIVRRDFGPVVANQVARRLVIAPHRDGGQAQFIERPILPARHGRLSALIGRLTARLDEPLSVESMAELAAMSRRNFIRRFREATGKWLTAARVERARELLETTALPIDEVARRSGFRTATTLRAHFRRRLRLSPREYRARFSTERDAGRSPVSPKAQSAF